MRAQTLSAAHGWRWLAGGLAIFRRNPPMLALLVAAYWFTLLFFNLFPKIGPLIASLLLPGLSVGLMQAARNVERGLPVSPQTLFAGLRENPRVLLLLGALYLLATMGIFGLSALFDGGELLRALKDPTHVDRAALAQLNLLPSLLFILLLLLPVTMAWWFAPVLAAWHRLSLGKALFFSLAACWLNWRAFTAYGVALLLVAGIAPGMVLGFLVEALPAAAPLISVLFMAAVALILAPVVFASFYVSYRDIFGISEIV